MNQKPFVGRAASVQAGKAHNTPQTL